MTLPINQSQIVHTTAEWQSLNPTLALDVIGIEVMSNGYNRYKRGDGSTAWLSLPYIDKVYKTDILVALYDNASGTNSNFTLAETAANFDMLRIFYTRDEGTLHQSVDLYDPNGKAASLSFLEGDASNLYFKFATVAISGTAVTWQTNGHAWAPNGGSVGINATSKPVKIVRVEGFKY